MRSRWYLDQPASLRMVGKAGGGQVPLVIVLPCTGGSAEDIYQQLQSELSVTTYAVLLPQGAPTSRDYLPAFGNFVSWFEVRLLADLQQALASHRLDRNPHCGSMIGRVARPAYEGARMSKLARAPAH